MQSWVVFACFLCLGVVGHRGFTIVQEESNRPLTPILLKSIAIHLPFPWHTFAKYAALLAESSIYTTNLYHDTAPICIAILLQKYQGQGSLAHSQIVLRQYLAIPVPRRAQARQHLPTTGEPVAPSSGSPNLSPLGRQIPAYSESLGKFCTGSVQTGLFALVL